MSASLSASPNSMPAARPHATTVCALTSATWQATSALSCDGAGDGQPTVAPAPALTQAAPVPEAEEMKQGCYATWPYATTTAAAMMPATEQAASALSYDGAGYSQPTMAPATASTQEERLTGARGARIDARCRTNSYRSTRMTSAESTSTPLPGMIATALATVRQLTALAPAMTAATTEAKAAAAAC